MQQLRYAEALCASYSAHLCPKAKAKDITPQYLPKNNSNSFKPCG
jgi:hypothetical protein